jgi:hypothetical protein
MEVVALVEHPAFDVRVQLTEALDLAVLLGDELLAHRGDLDEHVLGREVEVGPEELDRFAVIVPLDGEGLGLVLPVDAVEIEESREFPFAVVGEVGGVGWRRSEEIVVGQVAVASESPSAAGARSAWSG